MQSGFDGVMLWILIIGAAMGSGPVLRATNQHFRRPWMTITLAIMTCITSTLGNVFPAVLDALDRDRSLLLDGQWWRIVTPLFVQDGGWAGTIFNIVALLVLGAFVESLYSQRTLIIVYFAVGLISEAFAYTLLQHQGFAGNSVAVMGLAGLIGVTCVRSGPAPARIIGAIVLLAGIVLISAANLHGIGVAAGAIIGLLASDRAHLAMPKSSPGTG